MSEEFLERIDEILPKIALVMIFVQLFMAAGLLIILGIVILQAIV